MTNQNGTCPFYEKWEDEWQGGLGPQGATGSGCYINLQLNPCDGNPKICPLADTHVKVDTTINITKRE